MVRLSAALAAFCMLAGSTFALAAERVALVIGNSAYRHVAELANPKNDAEAMSTALERLGFEVIGGTDLTRVEFEDKVREFARAIGGSRIALFFYAGHGLQVNGSNYLAPVETQLLDEADLDFETVRLETILRQMEREPRTNLVFLDACRNNPMARNLARSMGTRSAAIGRGLAPIETGIGSLIAFATQPGNVALDGEGTNSPFTAALVKHIETPGEDIAVVLRRVRQEVIEQTGGRQVPWDNSSLTGSVMLKAAVRVPGEASEPSTALQKRLEELQKRLEAAEQRIAAAPQELPATVEEQTDKKLAVAQVESTVSEEPAGPAKGQLDDDAFQPLELAQDKRRDVQQALALLGHDPGPADGQFGPRTRSAISAARSTFSLPAGDYIDLALLERLPDVTKLQETRSKDARRYKRDDLPKNGDPRLAKAVDALAAYEIKYDYHDGHLYIAVLSWGLNWHQAKGVAEQAGGHLVTIGSSVENAFVYRLFAEDDRFVEVTSDGRHNGPWIGLAQQEGAPEPAGGWYWITGEPVTYRNWYPNAPFNYQGVGSAGEFWAKSGGSARAQWRDQDPSFSRRSFIIEIE